MQVILLQDVPKIGFKFQVKKVADGYGRNFLLARNLAELATPHSLKLVEKRREQHEKELGLRLSHAENELGSIAGKEITVRVKANDKGGLFAGIGKEEIRAFLKKEAMGNAIADYIELESPIKKVGEYQLPIKVGEKVGMFLVRVEAA